jgi:hypothetical protein
MLTAAFANAAIDASHHRLSASARLEHSQHSFPADGTIARIYARYGIERSEATVSLHVH